MQDSQTHNLPELHIEENKAGHPDGFYWFMIALIPTTLTYWLLEKTSLEAFVKIKKEQGANVDSQAIMPTNPCTKRHNETDRTTDMRRRRAGNRMGGVEGHVEWRVGVRSSIKVQLCNFIPVPAQWGMRLSSIWTCSGDLLTSVWGAPSNTHTHFLEPLTMSAPLQGNQASRDRSALAHVYIHGLNLASFLSAAGKKKCI